MVITTSVVVHSLDCLSLSFVSRSRNRQTRAIHCFPLTFHTFCLRIPLYASSFVIISSNCSCYNQEFPQDEGLSPPHQSTTLFNIFPCLLTACLCFNTTKTRQSCLSLLFSLITMVNRSDHSLRNNSLSPVVKDISLLQLILLGVSMKSVAAPT